MRTAILVIDRTRVGSMRIDIKARADELAATHSLEIVETVYEAEPRMIPISDYVDREGISVLITPALSHISHNAAFIRQRCDLLTMSPPSYQQRDLPQEARIR